MLVNIIQICVYDIYVSTYRDIYIQRERERETEIYTGIYICVYEFTEMPVYKILKMEFPSWLSG